MTSIAYFGDMSATTLLLVLDLVGIAVFGVSGALAGVDKKLDLFGVLFLSVATALGGGFIRDALIGATPAAALTDGRYLLVSAYNGATLTAYRITNEGGLETAASLAWDAQISDLLTLPTTKVDVQ